MTQREESVSIVRLNYYIYTRGYTVSTCINTSDIDDIANAEFGELLQQVHLGELDVVDLRIHERLEMYSV